MRSHFQPRGVVSVEFQDARTTAARTRCRAPRRCRLSGHGAGRAGGPCRARAARALGQLATSSLPLTSLQEIPSREGHQAGGERAEARRHGMWALQVVRHVLRTISPRSVPPKLTPQVLLYFFSFFFLFYRLVASFLVAVATLPQPTATIVAAREGSQRSTESHEKTRCSGLLPRGSGRQTSHAVTCCVVKQSQESRDKAQCPRPRPQARERRASSEPERTGDGDTPSAFWGKGMAS